MDNRDMDKYTTNDIITLYEEINYRCFSGDLPFPAVVIMDGITRKVISGTQGWKFDFDGVCFPLHGEPKYLIGIATGLKSDDFFNTVIHELIHVACMEKWCYSGHGKKFDQISQLILEEMK
jgi:hypothetical protein